ncbi:MAG: CFI-box-CTERM domain-containing protein [Anaerolineales bacterium]|nr:CFI-box-CTERM domain-containing protein [Anaerolineales bacterium]
MTNICFIPATCPSCGGELRVPENRSVVKCMYCGKDIIIQIPSEVKSSANVEALLNLARTAEELNKFEEAEKYYTQALEYDSDNIYAWLGRGYCAGMLSTSDSFDKIAETLTYIDKGFYGNKEKDEPLTQLLEKLPNEYIGLAIRYLTDIFNHWYIHCSLEPQTTDLERFWRWFVSLQILDWVYILNKDDPDEQNNIKREIVTFVGGVYCISPGTWEEERKRGAIKGALQKSKLGDDPDILAEINRWYGKQFDREKISGKKKKPDCFIATATMGNQDHPYVVELRNFRDGVLKNSEYGKIFIELYYRYSPPLANIIANKAPLKALSRFLLVDPAVFVARFFSKKTSSPTTHTDEIQLALLPMQ